MQRGNADQERRAENAASQRRRRERMTAEQIEERRAANVAAQRRRRERMPAEQREAERQRNAEWHRQRRQQRKAKRPADAERVLQRLATERAARAERERQRREAQEEEERTAERAANAERERRRRQARNQDCASRCSADLMLSGDQPVLYFDIGRYIYDRCETKQDDDDEILNSNAKPGLVSCDGKEHQLSQNWYSGVAEMPHLVQRKCDEHSNASTFVSGGVAKEEWDDEFGTDTEVEIKDEPLESENQDFTKGKRVDPLKEANVSKDNSVTPELDVQEERKKLLTVSEALDYLDELDEVRDLYIEPPDVGNLTDEDSGAEDNETVFHPESLSWNQLLAPAEFRVSRDNTGEEEQDTNGEEEQEVSDVQHKAKRRKVTQSSTMIKWEKSESKPSPVQIFPEPDFSKYRDFSILELFELFFDEEILEYTREQMTRYCQKKNWPDVSVSINELRVFFAILIVSGYNSLPNTSMYWSHDPDVHNKAISSAMCRERFDAIKKCLHFNAAYNLDKDDKYCKLRPLISHLQKKFMEHFIPSQNISHDELMVKYFGKHSCKQSICNKPIRFGYKMWCQNTPSGYLLAFDPYQGKTYKGNENIEKEFGKAASTVIHLIEEYSEDKKTLPYHFFFDNFFTTVPLLAELTNRGYNGTGTLRSNRLDKTCPVSSVETMGKKERGCHSSFSGIVGASEVVVTRWNDNAVVTVASTLLGQNPVGKVKRWSKKDSKHAMINIPHAVKVYNSNMGGTDRMDQNINEYRIGIRGKKWWWSLFTWMLDAAIHNAWQIAWLRGKPIKQVSFRRELAMAYLYKYQVEPKAPGIRKLSVPGEEEMRYDSTGHFVQPLQNHSRRKCMGENCNSLVRTECCKCDVGLCVPCFAPYHKRK